MKVLDLTTLYMDGGEGGVNTYLREKSRFLSEARGYRHTVIVPGSRSSTTRLWKTTVHCIQSPRLPRNPHHVLADFRRIGRLLAEEEPDVVEVDVSYLLGHVAARALRARRVPILGFYHVHLPFLHTRPRPGPLAGALRRRTEPLVWKYAELCARPCDRVVVTTRDMEARLSERSFPRLDLVPLGVNLDLFRPKAKGERTSIPGIDPGKPVLLFVGRLGREKDLDVLFTAHSELSRDPGTQLVIAGDGPLRGRVERFARSASDVVFLGTCPYGERLAGIYRSADVLAVPGRNETFSLTILEAFASGLPVVGVDQGGPSEILKPAVGELAQPGDARDFAGKVRSILGGKARGPACRRHAEKHYSWERTFEALLRVYESAIEDKNRFAERRRTGSRSPAEPLVARGA
jgi:alpha-1,6-mannosyltransferase